jgi:hypothetical protein
VQLQELPQVTVGLYWLPHVALHWSYPHVTLALLHTLVPDGQFMVHMPYWLQVICNPLQELVLVQVAVQL